MIQENSVHLSTSSILNLPLQTYDKDFSFIVNGEVFNTSKFQAQILSPNIYRMHASDSTIDTFIIKTQNCGDFSYFLNLAQFDTNNIPSSELPFFTEVREILGNTNIEWPGVNLSADITTDNIFSLLSLHEKYPIFLIVN